MELHDWLGEGSDGQSAVLVDSVGEKVFSSFVGHRGEIHLLGREVQPGAVEEFSGESFHGGTLELELRAGEVAP